MFKPQSGVVIRYAYLWAREYARGEESGRKTRPVCVQISFSGASRDQTALLFPVTSQIPAAGVKALQIPETEARRVRLRTPAWIIVEEWNEDNLATSDSIDDPEPLGAFSKAFVGKIREAVVAAIQSRNYRAVRR